MNLLSKSLTSASLVLVMGLGAATAQSDLDSLKRGFENPPESAHPRVWWH